MIIQFTLQGFMNLLVSAFGIAAGLILLPILWDIKKVLSVLRPLVETNQEPFKKSIKTIPGIFEDVVHISKNVRETTDKIKISAPVILKEVEIATNSAKESIELAGVIMGNMRSGSNDETAITYKKDGSAFMAYLSIFEEVLQIVYRTYSSYKQR